MRRLAAAKSLVRPGVGDDRCTDLLEALGHAELYLVEGSPVEDDAGLPVGDDAGACHQVTRSSPSS